MEENPRSPGFLEGIFTRQERLALLFLIGVALGGMSLLCLWRGRIPFMNPTEVIPGTSTLQLQVRVNAASTSELASLPGIGPTLAQRILEDRTAHGHFLTLADLKRVKGINRKVLEQVRAFVRFD